MTKTRAYLPALLLGLLTLVGCVSPTAVDYEHTATEKIAGYHCFAIEERPAGGSDADIVLSPIVDRRIERALRAELRAKGFSDGCPSPDFRVRFYTASRTRTRVHDLTMGTGLFRQYPHYSFGGYSQIEIDQYQQGTIVVDLIDAPSGQLVWRGSYTLRLGRTAPEAAEIEKIVGKILAPFPPGTPAARPN